MPVQYYLLSVNVLPYNKAYLQLKSKEKPAPRARADNRTEKLVLLYHNTIHNDRNGESREPDNRQDNRVRNSNKNIRLVPKQADNKGRLDKSRDGIREGHRIHNRRLNRYGRC